MSSLRQEIRVRMYSLECGREGNTATFLYLAKTYIPPIPFHSTRPKYSSQSAKASFNHSVYVGPRVVCVSKAPKRLRDLISPLSLSLFSLRSYS